MSTQTRTKNYRYDCNGQLLPPLPVQPKKQRPERAPRQPRDLDKDEADRRSSQSHLARLDELEAAHYLVMLKAIHLDAQPDERISCIIELLNGLARERASLRRSFVRQARYAARSMADERLARLMRRVADDLETYKWEKQGKKP